MCAFWFIGSSLAALEYVGELQDRKPPAFEVDPGPGPVLIDFDHASGEMIQRKWEPDENGFYWRSEPGLTVADAGFPLEWFEQNGTFVSATARRALAPAGSALRYRSVRFAGTPEEVVARDWRQMAVVAEEFIFDPERSSFVDPGAVPFRFPSLRLQANACSQASIFRDPRDARVLVTDAFARHLAEAGLTGLRFFDPEGSGTFWET